MDPVRIIPNPSSSSSPSSVPLLSQAPTAVDVVYVPQAAQTVAQVVPTDPESELLRQVRLRQARQPSAPLKVHARRFAQVAQSLLSEASGASAARRARAASIVSGGGAAGDTVVPVERAPTPPPPVPLAAAAAAASIPPYEPVSSSPSALAISQREREKDVVRAVSSFIHRRKSFVPENRAGETSDEM